MHKIQYNSAPPSISRSEPLQKRNNNIAKRSPLTTMAKKRKQEPEPEGDDDNSTSSDIIDDAINNNNEALSSESEDDDDVPPQSTSEIVPIQQPSMKSDGRYHNKQRLLVLSSRGITARYRHLLEDLRTLIPHSKKESKLDVGTFCVLNLFYIYLLDDSYSYVILALTNHHINVV